MSRAVDRSPSVSSAVNASYRSRAEDLAIGTEIGVRRVAGRDGLTPRGGQRGNDRAGERLVLTGLHRVGRDVVLLDRRQLLGAGQSGEVQRRPPETHIVTEPAGFVLRPAAFPTACGRLGTGGGHRGGLRGAEAESQRRGAIAAERDGCGLFHIAPRSRCRRPGSTNGSHPIPSGRRFALPTNPGADRGERPVGPQCEKSSGPRSRGWRRWWWSRCRRRPGPASRCCGRRWPNRRRRLPVPPPPLPPTVASRRTYIR